MILDAVIAQSTVRDYVCAHCYGTLTETFIASTRMSRVECPNCGEDIGFVTRKYADAKKAESGAEASEVKTLLQSLGMIEKPPKKSQEQLLKELGF